MEILPFIIIAVAGLLIVGIFVSLIATFIRNASSPRLAREARVVGKRLDVSGGKNGSSTYYYATFEFPDGSREEFGVGSKIYGMLAEGDLGTLHSQGTYVWEFNRRT
ncbi:MAG: DUF2500 domain-containing protein [Microcoleaceae cyanobacterium]